MPVYRDISERFHDAYIPEPNSGCWLWVLSVQPSGYGQMMKTRGYGGPELAHRLSWMLHNGGIPDGLCVLHKCDVRCCVNPNHLFLGTRAENMADMDRKGRRVNAPHKGRRHLQ